jgi:hypothetical protein
VINTSSKAAGYKINIQNSVAFLYINNEQAEKGIRKAVLFTRASKRLKYLGINLTKKVYKTSAMKTIKHYKRK